MDQRKQYRVAGSLKKGQTTAIGVPRGLSTRRRYGEGMQAHIDSKMLVDTEALLFFKACPIKFSPKQPKPLAKLPRPSSPVEECELESQLGAFPRESGLGWK